MSTLRRILYWFLGLCHVCGGFTPCPCYDKFAGKILEKWEKGW